MGFSSRAKAFRHAGVYQLDCRDIVESRLMSEMYGGIFEC